MPRANPGEVWIVDLGLAAKVRPCLVLSDYPKDDELSLVIMVPHTTAVRNNRWEVPIPKTFLKTAVSHRAVSKMNEGLAKVRFLQTPDHEYSIPEPRRLQPQRGTAPVPHCLSRFSGPLNDKRAYMVQLPPDLQPIPFDQQRIIRVQHARFQPRPPGIRMQSDKRRRAMSFIEVVWSQGCSGFNGVVPSLSTG
jgi:mRNA-degrading endonuclease toxin of MazEF toxin-antitoxin module